MQAELLFYLSLCTLLFSFILFDVCSCFLPNKAAAACSAAVTSCSRCTACQAASPRAAPRRSALPPARAGQLGGTAAACELTAQPCHKLSACKCSAASVFTVSSLLTKRRRNDIKHIALHNQMTTFLFILAPLYRL